MKTLYPIAITVLYQRPDKARIMKTLNPAEAATPLSAVVLGEVVDLIASSSRSRQFDPISEQQAAKRTEPSAESSHLMDEGGGSRVLHAEAPKPQRVVEDSASTGIRGPWLPGESARPRTRTRKHDDQLSRGAPRVPRRENNSLRAHDTHGPGRD
jgi:hypothetical protein